MILDILLYFIFCDNSHFVTHHILWHFIFYDTSYFVKFYVLWYFIFCDISNLMMFSIAWHFISCANPDLVPFKSCDISDGLTFLIYGNFRFSEISDKRQCDTIRISDVSDLVTS